MGPEYWSLTFFKGFRVGPCYLPEDKIQDTFSLQHGFMALWTLEMRGHITWLTSEPLRKVKSLTFGLLIVVSLQYPKGSSPKSQPEDVSCYPSPPPSPPLLRLRTWKCGPGENKALLSARGCIQGVQGSRPLPERSRNLRPSDPKPETASRHDECPPPPPPKPLNRPSVSAQGPKPRTPKP